MRGEAQHAGLPRRNAGGIPAPAGRSSRSRASTAFGTGHPNTCGAKFTWSGSRCSGIGTSPHLRGLLLSPAGAGQCMVRSVGSLRDFIYLLCKAGHSICISPVSLSSWNSSIFPFLLVSSFTTSGVEQFPMLSFISLGGHPCFPDISRGCRQSNLVQIAMARIWQMAR